MIRSSFLTPKSINRFVVGNNNEIDSIFNSVEDVDAFGYLVMHLDGGELPDF